MASEIKSDKLSPSTGTALQIGDASDTITIPTGATFTVTDGIGVASGGTGLASFTAGDILYATGSTTLAKLGKGTAEQVLAMNAGATAPDWGSVDLTVLPTITVAKGGTNLSSFTAGDVLYATGSTTLAKLAKGSADDVLTMNSGATAPEWAAAAGGGKLGAVVQTFKSDTTSVAQTFASGYTDITGMTVTTGTLTSGSKVLVSISINLGGQPNYSYAVQLVRDSTAIAIGDTASSRTRATFKLQADSNASDHFTQSMMYLDSPATTSATTYKLQACVENASYPLYINRDLPNTDSISTVRVVSQISAMEILA